MATMSAQFNTAGKPSSTTVTGDSTILHQIATGTNGNVSFSRPVKTTVTFTMNVAPYTAYPAGSWIPAEVNVIGPSSVPATTYVFEDEGLVDGGWVEYTTVGTTHVTVPSGAVRAEIMCLGGGGAGGYVKFGQGGTFTSGTVDAPSNFNVVVGGGGGTPGGANDSPSASDGSSSSALGIVGAYGQGGRSSATHKGVAADSSAQPSAGRSRYGRVFQGGAATSANSAANAPGGGGGPGSSAKAGASGKVWVRFWINPKLENIFVGGDVVHSVYYGSTPVKAVYVGSTLVYGA